MFVVAFTEGNYDYVYGPFEDAHTANGFRAFIAEECDPARVMRVASPVDAFLSWRDHQQNKAAGSGA